MRARDVQADSNRIPFDRAYQLISLSVAADHNAMTRVLNKEGR